MDKIKAAYPEIEKLDNDALRAKTEELKKYIHESATAERAKVEELGQASRHWNWKTAKKSSHKSIRQKKKFWRNMKKHWTKYCPLLFLS